MPNYAEILLFCFSFYSPLLAIVGRKTLISPALTFVFDFFPIPVALNAKRCRGGFVNGLVIQLDIPIALLGCFKVIP